MPLINGMKMACEPCIRGHRSTKCTHANERLMVPVRKPGRPLSACPHPKDQRCACGSVTAAIPRKQACHCGTSTPASPGQDVPQEMNVGGADAHSPSKSTFKVQKTTSKSQSSSRQSFDPARFERMDMNSINIVPFEQRSQAIPVPFANEYGLPRGPEPYGYIPPYPNIQAQFDQIPIQTSPHMHTGIPGRTNGFIKKNGNGFENVVESPVAMPKELNNYGSKVATNGGSCCAPPVTANGNNGKLNGSTNSGSCCAPKKPSHSQSSSSASSISEPQELTAGSCCSSKPATQIVKQESMSSTPNITPQISHQILPNETPFNPTMYPHYLPQSTVFTYPPTYGSFQNPLQPNAWRQNVLANSYGHPQMQAPIPPGGMPFGTRPAPETLDTVHTCHCGDGCQCIGCAAHPYNDATQDYVRSAWCSMNMDHAAGEVYTKRQSNGNGHNVPGGEPISSPTAHTPSSTTSGNGEEQSLSASDFFFVNYPFSSEDGCGGDMESCPCGDDCQCLGCTIHQQPPIPCEGRKDVCLCGDDCECIGCEIHNGTVKV